MSPRHFDAMHPYLERYYDHATDRDGVDAHVRICSECRTWLAEVHVRLQDLRCIELVELVTEYLDDAVSSELRARIDDHLRLCEGCRNYLDEMRSAVAALGRVGGSPEPSEPVQAALLAAFRAWRRSRSLDPGHEE